MDCNINAHDFVAKEYWQKNYPFVRDAIQYAEVYIYENNKKIVAFIGLQNDYIAGIFVKKKCRVCFNKRNLISILE